MAASFVPLPRGSIARFRLWHFPLAGPHVSWAVFESDPLTPGVGRSLARCVSWDRDHDLEELAVGSRRRPLRDPTLLVTDVELDTALLRSLRAAAARLWLPMHFLGAPYVSDRRAEFGLEGFEDDSRDGHPRVRMEWGREVPVAIKAIAHWADRVRRWLLSVPGLRGA
jgi:hypothetical protein